MQARAKSSDGSLWAFACAKVARHYWYVAGVIAVLAVLVTAALLFGGATLVAKPKPAGTPPKFGGSHSLGYFRQRLPDGRTCRYVIFDNSVGQAIKDRVDHCEDFMPPPSKAQTPVGDTDTQPPKFSWRGQEGTAPGSKD
jgi:hypothetical protein